MSLKNSQSDCDFCDDCGYEKDHCECHFCECEECMKGDSKKFSENGRYCEECEENYYGGCKEQVNYIEYNNECEEQEEKSYCINCFQKMFIRDGDFIFKVDLKNKKIYNCWLIEKNMYGDEKLNTYNKKTDYKVEFYLLDESIYSSKNYETSDLIDYSTNIKDLELDKEFVYDLTKYAFSDEDEYLDTDSDDSNSEDSNSEDSDE